MNQNSTGYYEKNKVIKITRSILDWRKDIWVEIMNTSLTKLHEIKKKKNKIVNFARDKECDTEMGRERCT